MDAKQILDAYFADQLGCVASDLQRREVVLVSSVTGPKPFQGYGTACGCLFPRPLWAVQTTEGLVISVQQDWLGEVEQLLDGVEDGHGVLSLERWGYLRASLTKQHPALSFGQDIIFYCDRRSLVPCCVHECILLPEAHPLRRTYGPEVPAVSAIVSADRVVSHAHVKPSGSSAVREIAVGTDPEHRGKGYAKAVVSLATQFVLDAGGVALYSCRDDNHPSLAVARRLGYKEYGRHLLCFGGGG